MKFILFIVWSILLLTSNARAAAEAPALNLLMQHDILWTRDGVPASMRALAQTADGWLWLGGQSGLYRYDGVRFERYDGRAGKLPLSNIFEMGSTPAGALWLTYRYGGLSIMHEGKLRNYGAADGLPAGTLRQLAVGPDGRMVVGAGFGVYGKAADSQTWAPVRASNGPEDEAQGIIFDSRGILWVQTATAVYSLAPGAARFERHGEGGFGEVHEAPDGSVWASSAAKGGLRMLRAPRQGAPVNWPRLGPAAKFMFDRVGNLWLQQSSGVSLVSAASLEVNKSTSLQGASGLPQALLQDREGTVWTIGSQALERFHAKKLNGLALPHYMAEGRPIAALPGGGVWVDRYALATPDAIPKPEGAPQTPLNIVSTVHVDRSGALWKGGNGGLFQIQDGKTRQVAVPEGMEGGPIYAIADTADGLWISIARGGLYVLKNGKWQHEGGYPALARFRPTTMVAGPQGQFWLGSTGNRLVLLENGKLRLFGPGQGLLVGTTLAIRPLVEATWVGGENGVFRYDGKQFVQLSGLGDDFLGASGIVFDETGAMWINGLGGISRIAASELVEAARQPGYKVRFQRYDNRDGLQGGPAQIAALPSAVEGSDGRLWFSLSDAVYSFMPSQLPRNPLAPPVYVTQLSGDGAPYGLDGKAELAAGTGHVQIDYTALSLVRPERVRFRYRLIGVDKDWQDPGARRAALYTNLAPGSYRFEVKASNNDGVWNETGAAIVFGVKPTLVQSAWFRVLCALALLAAGWLLHRWRLQRAAAHALARLQARLDERERIARELHDTLLQSVQGLLLQVHAAAMLLPTKDHAHGVLTLAVDRASAAIEEGRDRVHALRSHSEPASDLVAAICQAAREAGGTLAINTSKSGREQPLHAVAREELLAIGREALLNAVRHSGGTAATVALHFRKDELVLEVGDNGKGIAPAVQGGRAGHWGMTSIRERAVKLGGRAELDSNSEGTIWRVTLPGALAYVRAPRKWLAGAL